MEDLTPYFRNAIIDFILFLQILRSYNYES